MPTRAKMLTTGTTVGLIACLIPASKYINFADPTTLMVMRIVYATSQALIFSVLVNIKAKIDEIQTSDMVKTTDKTIKEHDLAEWKSKRKQLLFTLALVFVLIFYLGKPEPLFLQSIVPWKLFFDTPLFKVYVMEQKAEGSLARPWSAPKATQSIQEALTTAEDKQTSKGKQAKKRKAHPH